MKDSYLAFAGAVVWTVLGASNYVQIVDGKYDGWDVLLFVASLLLVPFSLRRGVIYTIKENS